MKRSLIAPPDAFSLSPLLSLLPVVGEVGALETFASSLFARYETVSTLLQSLSEDHERELFRRCKSEEEMLRLVLEWLSMKPEYEK